MENTSNPTLGKLRQEGHKAEVSLNYKASPCLNTDTHTKTHTQRAGKERGREKGLSFGPAGRVLSLQA